MSNAGKLLQDQNNLKLLRAEAESLRAENAALIEALERIMDTSTGCVAGHYQIADAALDALSQTKGKGE